MTTATIEQFREQCAKTAYHCCYNSMSSSMITACTTAAALIRALPLPAMPEQAEPVAKRELINLYESVNKMMLFIGAYGEVDKNYLCVQNVMNALHALDGGNVITRADELIEKAFMPAYHAYPKAVSEYIAKLEGSINTFDLLARIAELEAENQKMKEGK